MASPAFKRAWEAIRVGDDVTASALAQACHCSKADAARLLRALARRGDVVDGAPQPRGLKAWRMTREAAANPRPADPRERRASNIEIKREHLWNALRRLGAVGAKELAVTASTDVVRISEATALRYLRELHEGRAVFREGDRRAPSWRLRPAANTGPKPPRLRADGTLDDPNVTLRRAS